MFKLQNVGLVCSEIVVQVVWLLYRKEGMKEKLGQTTSC